MGRKRFQYYIAMFIGYINSDSRYIITIVAKFETYPCLCLELVVDLVHSVAGREKQFNFMFKGTALRTSVGRPGAAPDPLGASYLINMFVCSGEQQEG